MLTTAARNNKIPPATRTQLAGVADTASHVVPITSPTPRATGNATLIPETAIAASNKSKPRFNHSSAQGPGHLSITRQLEVVLKRQILGMRRSYDERRRSGAQQNP